MFIIILKWRLGNTQKTYSHWFYTTLARVVYQSLVVITVEVFSLVALFNIWSSKRIPSSSGGGWGNLFDWWRIVCNVGKSDVSRLISLGNVLNVVEGFGKISLNILFVGLMIGGGGGWKLTFFPVGRRTDFRVRVETADDEHGFGWLCKRSRSDVDDDSPLYGQERSEEEYSPSVVDGGWEVFQKKDTEWEGYLSPHALGWAKKTIITRLISNTIKVRDIRVLIYILKNDTRSLKT